MSRFPQPGLWTYQLCDCCTLPGNCMSACLYYFPVCWACCCPSCRHGLDMGKIGTPFVFPIVVGGSELCSCCCWCFLLPCNRGTVRHHFGIEVKTQQFTGAGWMHRGLGP